MMAEIVKHFLPKLVDVHNYPASNAIAQKRANWHTLNCMISRARESAFQSNIEDVRG